MAKFLEGKSQIVISNALRNSAPSSILAANAATHFKVVQLVKIASFGEIGQASFGIEPRGECPPALLCALDAVK